MLRFDVALSHAPVRAIRPFRRSTFHVLAQCNSSPPTKAVFRHKRQPIHIRMGVAPPRAAKAARRAISEDKERGTASLPPRCARASTLSTAAYLINLVRAVRLLGAEAIITGIRPSVAQTIISVGVDLSGIPTRVARLPGYSVKTTNNQSRRRRTAASATQPACPRHCSKNPACPRIAE